MHRFLALLSSLVAVVSTVFAMGCSSSTTPAASGDGGTPCGTDTVSFSNDVIPVFQMSCTVSMSCHGQMGNVGEENLYLAENMGTTDAKTVYGMLVGVPAKEDPSMNLVTAGSTDQSYLWHKLVNDQNSPTLAAACAKVPPPTCTDCNVTTPCGGLMPYDSESLSMTEPQFLCTIQNWIAQGAKNN